MRISTALMYNTGSTAISRQQSDLARTQQQISTGRRMLTPADDPVASAEALRVEQARAQTEQFQSAQGAARDRLQVLEASLGNAGDLYQSIRQLAVQGGNGGLTNVDRTSLAKEIRGLREQMMSVANTSDGQGGYLFAGSRSDVIPFDATPTGVVYQGDQGQRLFQVASGRQLPVTANGAEVFDRVRNGNGSFATSATLTNTGTAVVGKGSVVDASLLTRHNYQVNFTVAAGVTTYAVVDTNTSTTLSTGNPYTAGNAITFDGMSFTVTGAPANGDSLGVAPSTQTSAFDMIDKLISTLETPLVTDADKARFQNAMGQSLTHLDQAIDTALTVQTGVGASLRELDGLGDMASAAIVSHGQRLSELTDLDLAAAISKLSLQSTSLQAAQQAYIKTTGLSLFDFLR